METGGCDATGIPKTADAKPPKSIVPLWRLIILRSSPTFNLITTIKGGILASITYVQWSRAFAIRRRTITGGVILSMLILGVMLPADYAVSENEDLALYYNECLDKKIAQCERIAESERASSNQRFQTCAVVKREQAQFYCQHRQKLVRQMIQRRLGRNPQKVDYFLTMTFFDSRDH